LSKEKICESSPIELQVTAYGQWTLTTPRERAELQPPLSLDNPLMNPVDHVIAAHGLRKVRHCHSGVLGTTYVNNSSVVKST
jgi:hypothetical protein